jgi:hypothetical protein
MIDETIGKKKSTTTHESMKEFLKFLKVHCSLSVRKLLPPVSILFRQIDIQEIR